MRVSKILGYVMVVQLLVSFIASVAANLQREEQLLHKIQDVIRWSSYVWAYAVLIMGIYLKKQTGQYREVAIACFAALFCFFPLWGFGAAFLYFFWAFARLDKRKNGLPF